MTKPYLRLFPLLLLLIGCRGNAVPELVLAPELGKVLVTVGEESLTAQCEVSSMERIAACGLYLENADGSRQAFSGKADGNRRFVVEADPLPAGEYRYRAFISSGKDEVLSEEGQCVVLEKSTPQPPVNPDGTLSVPDPVFLAYLLKHFDADKDGVIGPDEAEAIEEIDIPTTDVVSLEGIAGMPHLRILKCRSGKYPTYIGEGKLEMLDVSRNAELEELWCEGNLLTSLDLTQNTALLKLSCKGNRLVTLDVSKCASLSYLDCAPMMDEAWQNLLKILYVGLDQNFVYANVPQETEIKTVY